MVLWLDVETTGLDPKKHSIIQIGALITKRANGKVIDSFNDTCDIIPGDEIDPYAMKVNGIDPDVLKHRQTSHKMFALFMDWLELHRGGKYLCAGYNVRFDIDYLMRWSARLDMHDLRHYIKRNGVDVMNLVITYEALDKIGPFENHKLTTVARAMNVKLSGHDAYSDIKATHKIFRKLTGIRP